jgi:hypothetical protein
MTPLRRLHAEATLLAAPGRKVAALRRPIFRGARSVKHPVTALLVQEELGNVRHALSQRVVAGTMVVHFAPGDGPAPAAEGSAAGPSAGPSAPPHRPSR